MEAIGAVSAVVAIVELAGMISVSAASFMRDVKDARKDMIQVRKDLSDLSTILRMVAEDLDHDKSPAGDNMQSRQHIIGIAHSCRTILVEIETVLREGRSQLRWVASGKARVEKLRERLETCKLSLDVALDYRTMVVVHDIKEESTRIVGDLSTIQHDITLILGKVDNIERKASAVEYLPDVAEPPGGVMLDRFLYDCRSDAQTVLDNIEYQRDHVFESVPPQVILESVPTQTRNEIPDFTSSNPLPTILFSNSLGHVCEIPLDQCRTWTQMDEIIKRTYPEGSANRKEIGNGLYSLILDGQDIPQKLWEMVVRPGLYISLNILEDPKAVIHFKDAVGRRFNYPWSLAKTWEGMEDLIKQAFAHVEVVGPHVQEGHYDLVTTPDGEIVLPVVWEKFIEPGMKIDMRMWPIEKPRPPSRPPMQWMGGGAGVGTPPRPEGRPERQRHRSPKQASKRPNQAAKKTSQAPKSSDQPSNSSNHPKRRHVKAEAGASD
ncbi:hypothetical protein Daus18300_011532 [Diaporthe australafricana]|uniref:Ubiquitin-like domain-containing protein n=1 Tax=Diaporthe australafricana TaxID=127596 RepID=A0ABR3W6L7_9PEZI